MRTAVVVPSNRPERVEQFCVAWEPQFNRSDVTLMVVEDGPECVARLPRWVQQYSWADMDELGSAGECIPRRSGGCRDFGFYLAGRDASVDMVVSLDDDVAPVNPYLPLRHWEALETAQMGRWFSPTPFPCRGLPYRVRDGSLPVLNHGLWQGMPDIDAYTQLQRGEAPWEPDSSSLGTRQLPPGQYYPMSIMNVAWRREYTRYMWMPSLPEGCKRWDDIWCGLVFKRVADLHGWSVVTGSPLVHHTRASNVVNNLRQEMLGYGINEELWQALDRVEARGRPEETWEACWERIGFTFPALRETARLAHVWAGLWETGE